MLSFWRMTVSEYNEYLERVVREEREVWNMGIEGIDALKPGDEGETYVRVSGDMVCPVCGETYYKHPTEVKYDSIDAQVMSLRRACDGRLLKL